MARKAFPVFEFGGFASQTPIAIETDAGLFTLNPDGHAPSFDFSNPDEILISGIDEGFVEGQIVVSISYVLTVVTLLGKKMDSVSVPFSHKFKEQVAIETTGDSLILACRFAIIERIRVGNLLDGVGKGFWYWQFIN